MLAAGATAGDAHRYLQLQALPHCDLVYAQIVPGFDLRNRDPIAIAAEILLEKNVLTDALIVKIHDEAVFAAYGWPTSFRAM